MRRALPAAVNGSRAKMEVLVLVIVDVVVIVKADKRGCG